MLITIISMLLITSCGGENNGIHSYFIEINKDDYEILAMVWLADSNSYINIWSKEFIANNEEEYFFSLHENDGNSYFIFTIISDSDWGYFRSDYFYSIKNGDVERVFETRLILNEAVYDTYLNRYVINNDFRFFINNISVCKYDYDDKLKNLGVELFIIDNTHTFSDKSTIEWQTTKINFNKTIALFNEYN